MNFNRLIENPLFFKWIFHSSPEINAWWDHYLENNPENRKQILDLKSQIETYLKFEDKKLSESEKRSLAIRIARKLEQADNKKVYRLALHRMMQYAAIAFIFLFIGGSLVYLYMERRQPQIVVENATLPAHVQEPVLILGDNSRVPLNKGESQLEYSASGKIVLNQEQTIKNDNASGVPPEMNTLVIPYGSRSTINLADGTTVWLNAGSRLIYPSRFVDKTREVFLIGEAYFDVKENEKQPFVVKTSDVLVEVTGTKFNITAYPEDFAVQTVLAEGSVEIKSTGAGKRKGLTLEPGYLAYFNKKTRETRTQKVNTDEYTLWTSGLFSFSNTDFNRITKKLERYYNIQFQYDDPFKGGIQVSGKLDVTKERTEVFNYLERLTGLQIIEINEMHYVIR